MLDIVALAFQKCPKLSNLIIEYYGQHKDIYKMDRKPESLQHDVHPVAAEDFRRIHRYCLESMQFDVWDILKPAHDVSRALDSLVLLDSRITCPQDWKFPTTTIFQNLKHLRHLGTSSDFLSSIVARAPKLRSIGILGTNHIWDPCSLQLLLGKSVLEHLQACSLNRLAPVEDDVVAFLLRHSSTLQDLRLMNETYGSVIDWSSFARRMRGQLPNLRRVEFSGLGQRHAPQWTPWYGWAAPPPITAADILRDCAHGLETGPMEVEVGLWEDYEELFFPQKCKS
jgi:hypothetical protein